MASRPGKAGGTAGPTSPQTMALLAPLASSSPLAPSSEIHLDAAVVRTLSEVIAGGQGAHSPLSIQLAASRSPDAGSRRRRVGPRARQRRHSGSGSDSDIDDEEDDWYFVADTTARSFSERRISRTMRKAARARASLAQTLGPAVGTPTSLGADEADTADLARGPSGELPSPRALPSLLRQRSVAGGAGRVSLSQAGASRSSLALPHRHPVGSKRLSRAVGVPTSTAEDALPFAPAPFGHSANRRSAATALERAAQRARAEAQQALAELGTYAVQEETDAPAPAPGQPAASGAESPREADQHAAPADGGGLGRAGSAPGSAPAARPDEAESGARLLHAGARVAPQRRRGGGQLQSLDAQLAAVDDGPFEGSASVCRPISPAETGIPNFSAEALGHELRTRLAPAVFGRASLGELSRLVRSEDAVLARCARYARLYSAHAPARSVLVLVRGSVTLEWFDGCVETILVTGDEVRGCTHGGAHASHGGAGAQAAPHAADGGAGAAGRAGAGAGGDAAGAASLLRSPANGAAPTRGAAFGLEAAASRARGAVDGGFVLPRLATATISHAAIVLLVEPSALPAVLAEACALELRYRLLARQPLFRQLPPRVLAPAARLFTLRRATRGEGIVLQGDEADSFQMVLRGTVSVLLLTPERRLVEVARIAAGSHAPYFGELALSAHDAAGAEGARAIQRIASVVALDEVWLLVLRRPHFQPALELIPDWRERFARAAEALERINAIRLQHEQERQLRARLHEKSALLAAEREAEAARLAQLRAARAQLRTAGVHVQERGRAGGGAEGPAAELSTPPPGALAPMHAGPRHWTASAASRPAHAPKRPLTMFVAGSAEHGPAARLGSEGAHELREHASAEGRVLRTASSAEQGSPPPAAGRARLGAVSPVRRRPHERERQVAMETIMKLAAAAHARDAPAGAGGWAAAKQHVLIRARQSAGSASAITDASCAAAATVVPTGRAGGGDAA